MSRKVPQRSLFSKISRQLKLQTMGKRRGCGDADAEMEKMQHRNARMAAWGAGELVSWDFPLPGPDLVWDRPRCPSGVPVLGSLCSRRVYSPHPCTEPCLVGSGPARGVSAHGTRIPKYLGIKKEFLPPKNPSQLYLEMAAALRSSPSPQLLPLNQPLPGVHIENKFNESLSSIAESLER